MACLILSFSIVAYRTHPLTQHALDCTPESRPAYMLELVLDFYREQQLACACVERYQQEGLLQTLSLLFIVTLTAD